VPELHALTAHELRQRISAGEVTAREVTEATLRRIEALDPRVRAFVTVTADTALAQADSIDARRQATRSTRGAPPLPPLAGVPIALKDNFCTAGIRTTCSSKILGEWRPP
jgi:aspartyl-tRNA(Asn)/glutamyl-tRNA(Gln) amidotransferase subunit A